MTKIESNTVSADSSQSALRPVSRSDFAALQVALARAFRNDPAVAYICEGDTEDQRLMRAMFRIYLGMMAPAGRCVMLARGGGAALWADPPGRLRLTRAQSLALAIRGFATMGPRAFSRLGQLTEIVGRSHPKQPPHAYLACLGVDPSLQGKGLGGQLLRERLAALDLGKQPAYLETAEESNLTFYQRYGFEVTRELKVPQGNLRLWLMWRDPRPVQAQPPATQRAL